MQCDYFGCGNIAVGDFPIPDEDGEDQGTENLCHKHAPYRTQAFSTSLPDSIDEWLASLKKAKVSNLVAITNPLDRDQVQRLVTQTESLNQIQNNVRDHRSI